MAIINVASGLNVRLTDIQAKVSGVAMRAAVDAMSTVGIAAIEVELNKSSHDAGEMTSSTAPNPPARVTGHLGASVVATPTVIGDGFAMKEVGSTAPYARIQEFGGTIHPVKADKLAWVGMGGMHFGKSVTLPARPYLKPALDLIVASGELSKAAADAFLASLIV